MDPEHRLDAVIDLPGNVIPCATDRARDVVDQQDRPVKTILKFVYLLNDPTLAAVWFTRSVLVGRCVLMCSVCLGRLSPIDECVERLIRFSRVVELSERLGRLLPIVGRLES